MERPGDFPLSQEQYQLLHTLVQTPSWFVAPNRNIPSHDETPILNLVAEMLERQDANVYRITAGSDGELRDPYKREGVFAERGALEDPSFTVLLYAHVDTVYPDGFPIAWPNPLSLNRHGDTLSGLGVYDMKAGVMEVIDTFQSVDVPDGVRLQVALCHDEEMESWGAIDLVYWLKRRNCVPDLILSPEIATIEKRQGVEGEGQKKDVIVNRIGHVKSTLDVTVPQAHRSQAASLDAEQELNHFRNYISAGFEQDKQSHPYFGKRTDQMRFTEYHVERASGFSNTTNGFIRMSYLNVPGRSVQEVLDWEKKKIDECGKIRNWTRKGLQYTFRPSDGETSYEPYMLNLSGPVEQMVLSSVAHIYGGYKAKSGGSTSDANILRAHFPHVPCFDIGPAGGQPHHREEWVSAESIARNIAWLRYVITEAIPGYLNRGK